MKELLSIINTDIRKSPAQDALSKFSFKRHRQADDLNEGVKTEYWFSDKGNGIELICSNQYLIRSIFLHSGRNKREKSRPYPYPLLEGLSFDSSRENVRLALGKPTVEGAPRRIPGLGDYGAYDRYDYVDWSIHFQYALNSEQIEMVTLMSKECVPTNIAV